MAPPAKAAPKKRAPATCPVCDATVSRKADLPRHMRLHSAFKDELMYHCTYDGCSYKNLQKSNFETHLRIHTGEKAHGCPDCDFAAADPGSITRHRKKYHGYEPKSRRSFSGKVTTLKPSVRRSPYSRGPSSSSCESSMACPSTEVSSSGLPATPSGPIDLPPVALEYPVETDPACSGGSPLVGNYFWDGTQLTYTGTLSPNVAPNVRSPSPNQLSPAVEAGKLEDAQRSPSVGPDHFGILPSLPWENTKEMWQSAPSMWPKDGYVNPGQTIGAAVSPVSQYPYPTSSWVTPSVSLPEAMVVPSQNAWPVSPAYQQPSIQQPSILPPNNIYLSPPEYPNSFNPPFVNWNSLSPLSFSPTQELGMSAPQSFPNSPLYPPFSFEAQPLTSSSSAYEPYIYPPSSFSDDSSILSSSSSFFEEPFTSSLLLSSS